jgi:deoxyxylulose-5-phosphate synthase
MNYPKELLNQTNCQEGISVKYSDGKYPTVYLSNSEFYDPEILIISHGGNAILIEDLLMELLIEHELAVQANFPSLIKPVVFDELFYGIENCKMIIVIEESPKSFGWGNEIVAYIAESGLAEGKSIARVGADESPIPSSTLLEQKILPGIEDVFHVIKSAGMI